MVPGQCNTSLIPLYILIGLRLLEFPIEGRVVQYSIISYNQPRGVLNTAQCSVRCFWCMWCEHVPCASANVVSHCEMESDPNPEPWAFRTIRSKIDRDAHNWAGSAKKKLKLCKMVLKGTTHTVHGPICGCDFQYISFDKMKLMRWDSWDQMMWLIGNAINHSSNKNWTIRSLHSPDSMQGSISSSNFQTIRMSNISKMLTRRQRCLNGSLNLNAATKHLKPRMSVSAFD